MLNIAWARAAARRIGAEVWAATDADDLKDILDASINDASYSKRTTNIVGQFFKRKFPELQSFKVFTDAVERKSADPDAVSASLRSGINVAAAIARLREANHAKELRADDYFRSGGDLPDAMWDASLDLIRAFVCMSALIDVAISDAAPPEWLLASVVDGWANGQRSFLAVWAMFYDASDVPEDVIPASMRLDLNRIVAEHKDRERRFDRFIDSHIK